MADMVVAAAVVAINHLGGWKSQPPGMESTSDLQSLAVKNLSDLVHRHGLWKVEDVSVNFVRISLKESPLITWVKR